MSDSSKASAASQSSAVVGEDGMRSGGRPMVTAAAAHSTPARAMVRHPIGVSLNSPKQPQPASGRRCRVSFSAPTATRKNSAVPARTTVAGRPAPPAPTWPAVAISARPRPSSVAHIVIMTGRRRRSGSRPVGTMAGVSDRVRSTRHALAAQPPSSRAASSGICSSLTAVSIA